MKPPSSRSRELAIRLLAETSAPGATGSGAARVLERMDGVLSRLAGDAGSRTLLVRTLTLAKREVPWLKAVQATPGSVLGTIEEQAARAGPQERFDGEVLLVACLLELLHAFIGEPLTLRLVNEAWPGLVLRNEDAVNGPNP